MPAPVARWLTRLPVPQPSMPSDRPVPAANCHPRRFEQPAGDDGELDGNTPPPCFHPCALFFLGPCRRLCGKYLRDEAGDVVRATWGSRAGGLRRRHAPLRWAQCQGVRGSGGAARTPWGPPWEGAADVNPFPGFVTDPVREHSVCEGEWIRPPPSMYWSWLQVRAGTVRRAAPTLDGHRRPGAAGACCDEAREVLERRRVGHLPVVSLAQERHPGARSRLGRGFPHGEHGTRIRPSQVAAGRVSHIDPWGKSARCRARIYDREVALLPRHLRAPAGAQPSSSCWAAWI
jgi:hypothetical protein